ncbi:MAG TPA: hypothetical protein VHU85_15370 [Acidimicrobiales bacterium]|jgi:hypothetical protein|nr:hypothetical protein [Acidimicrobiales bacterium]
MINNVDQLDLTDDETEDAFFERAWTDGLPIRVPRVERVDAFVASSGLDPNVRIGTVPPAHGVATIGNVAINAFMAGCKPEHLAIVCAAVEALLKEPFNLWAVQCTTNPVTPLVIINGPVRETCGVNCGLGTLGPGRNSNGVIGRAVRFVMGNLGGSFDEKIDMATHGSPLKYTFCVGEAEEESPWEPLHVWLGYDATESVVTTAPIEGLIDVIPSYGNTKAHHLLDHMGRVMRTMGTSYYWSQGNPVLIMNPTHASILCDAGYSREDVQQTLFQEARVPLDTLPHGNIPVGDWTVVDGQVLGMRRAEDIYIVVAGQTGGHHTMYGMGFCLSDATSAALPSA